MTDFIILALVVMPVIFAIISYIKRDKSKDNSETEIEKSKKSCTSFACKSCFGCPFSQSTKND